MSTTKPAHRSDRRSTLLLAAAGYLLFIVYGSLVPLNFNPRPLEAVWRDFLSVRYFVLGVESRADWIANGVLYMPLGYLMSAWLAAPRRSAAAALARASAVFAACTAVALGVEFTQLFFPPRTVSMNDIIAEVIGSALGIAVWGVWGGALGRRLVEMTRGGMAAIRAAAVIYVLAYLTLSLFPYDFFISMQEFSRKLASDRYALLVAPAACAQLSVCASKLIAEVMTVIPLGVLLGMVRGKDARRGYASAAWFGLALGFAIEVGQLFIASGVSQGVSLLTRASGMLLGVALHRHARRQWLLALQAHVIPLLLLACVPYLLALMWLNGWFSAGWVGIEQARENTLQINWLPFYYHYFTTEQAALTSLLANAALYAPVGLAYWAWTLRRSHWYSTGIALMPALVAVPLALAMEIGKLFIPGKHPDPTNVLIAGFAAYAAYRIIAAIVRWAGEDAQGVHAPARDLRKRGSTAARVESGRAGPVESGQPGRVESGQVARIESGRVARVESRRVAGRASTRTERVESAPGARSESGQSARIDSGKAERLASGQAARVGSGPAACTLSLALSAMVLGFVAFYPYGGWLALFLAAYAACLWRWPNAALPAVLALLPVLDLAPWSGWFFFDEFDAVLLVTVAVLLWRIPPAHWSPWGAGIPLWVALPLAASYVISALIGLMPLQAIDLNAFAGYYSHYNSLRILKGFWWALLLAGPTIHQLRRGGAGQRAFSAGMLLGLFGVSVAALWERNLFPGLLNFSSDYRITATFSSMHVGGAFIEAYLILAIPFLAVWAHLKRGPRAIGAVVALFGLASYALLVTFARGGYLGYAGAVGILGISAVLHSVKERLLSARAVVVSMSLLATGLALAILVLTGTYMQSRWAAVQTDAEARTQHWRDAIGMMDDGPRTMLFGMGLGRFPETYFYRNPAGKVPAMYRFVREDGNVYLSLGSGEALYYGQRVPVEAAQKYGIELDLRSESANVELTLALCEKNILYSENCQWFTLPAKGLQNGWEHRRLEINSGDIARGPWYLRRPVEFALTNSKAGTVVDVDNVKLLDSVDRRNLVQNGDFSRGHDHWLLSVGNPWPWHVENIALQVFFEQGGYGLLAIGVVVIFGLARLGQGVARGDLFSGVLLAALAGFLLVGLFGSLFDAPRLTLMFFLLLFAATALPRPTGGREVR